MRKIGLLQTGQLATAFYLEKLNSLYRHKGGSVCDLPIQIIETNFAQINRFLPDGHSQVRELLNPALRKASETGVTDLLVPNITLHEILDQMIGSFDFKLIHPIAIGIENLNLRQIRTVSVLGTRHTMQRNYIRGHFENAGIQIVDLSQSQISILDQLRLEVFAGKDRSEALEKILKLLSPSVDALVLACTELSVAAQHSQVRNVVDLVDVQIERTVEILQTSEMPEN